MTPKQLVARFFQAGYTDQDYDFALQCMADDYFDHSPAAARSNRDAVGILQLVAQQFSGFTAEVLDSFAENGMVAARVRFSGVHTGECMGVAPTGARITFEALENFRVEGGKIVESWGYWPDKDIERQLLAARG